jgi:DNA polymerase V
MFYSARRISGKEAPMEEKCYVAIDLKSFYASVECRERGLDPLRTNLVVADASRTEKTICLAVSPSLKSFGISGRARLFEVVQRVKEVNRQRLAALKGRSFTGSSTDYPELMADPSLSLDYIAAPPRMALYMKYSTQIYKTYLKYVAPEDIHVYSIDEVFIDATKYLKLYKKTPHDFTMMLIRDVLAGTGITATAGIGTNLFLCKIAMDITAKHMEPDRDGVRVAQLDELSYRRQLWDHTPITDFWRVGPGTARRLAQHGMYTMGDVARCSLGRPQDPMNEALLYRIFGINAELLIDHAWGYEPATIADIKAYVPENNSLSSGQVLMSPYEYVPARLVVKEMTDLLSLELVSKHMVCDQLTLDLIYDTESLSDPKLAAKYSKDAVADHYGRRMPKPSHGSINLKQPTSSTSMMIEAINELFSRIADPALLVRRIYIGAIHVVPESLAQQKEPESEQLSMFTDYKEEEQKKAAEKKELEEERRRQEAILAIKQKFGKNAIFKGMNLEEGATGRERNRQIGGHKA